MQHYLTDNYSAYIKNYTVFFLFLICSITLLRLGIIASHAWPINGDEAQYWGWSQHLALGYYSKPPLIAYLIYITTHLFGNGIIGLRLASPLAHALTALVIYAIGKRLFDARIGFWAGLTYLLAPGVSFSADIISTDPPLLLFWALSLYAFIRALDHNALHWWLACGAALGLAFLSKYAASAFLLSALLYLLTAPKNRYVLRKPGLYLGLLITLMILLPNIYWNFQNGFASIVAVKDNAAISHHFFHFDHMLNFVGSQLGVFGPVAFITLCMIFIQWRSIVRDERLRLLLYFAFPLLLIMTVEGLLARAHANWAAPSYVSASIVVAAVLILRDGFKWLILAFILNLIAIVGLFYIKPFVRFVGIKLPVSQTSTHWPQTGARIKALRKNYPHSLVLVDDRMLLSRIMYFAQVPLAAIFKWNPTHAITGQYDLVTHLKREKGRNFILFSYHANPSSIFARFAREKPIATLHLPTLDGRGVNVYAFYLQDFKEYS